MLDQDGAIIQYKPHEARVNISWDGSMRLTDRDNESRSHVFKILAGIPPAGRPAPKVAVIVYANVADEVVVCLGREVMYIVLDNSRKRGTGQWPRPIGRDKGTHL